MRIYFDENFSPALISGLKRIQDGRRSEGIDVCSVKEEFGQGCRDEEWIPEIAKRHGVIITQDLNINRTRAQWQLRSEEHTSELQSRGQLVCRLLLEKKK